MSDDKKGFEPQYDDNKDEDVIYFGKAVPNADGSEYRKMELFIGQSDNYLSEKNKDYEAEPVEFTKKEDIVLYHSTSGQQKIHCWLTETKYGKRITALNISRRTGKGVYGSQEVTLTVDAINALKLFLNNLHFIDTLSKRPFKVPFSDLEGSQDAFQAQAISDDEFNELIKANINSTDDFYKLLSVQKMELSISRLEGIISGDYDNEVSIQKFLKENMWMFGNDYAFVVENGKINAKNILDLIPKDLESYIDIIEVKLPNEALFNFDNSHKNYYSTSNLTKAIAQTQNYIFELENKTLDEEYQNKNNCKIVRPQGVILFGSENELSDEEKKYLRILNSSYHNLKIITYQQLLEKAKNAIGFIKQRNKEILSKETGSV